MQYSMQLLESNISTSPKHSITYILLLFKLLESFYS